MKRAMIEFINYSLKYDVQTQPTLNNINLRIDEGEMVAIIGPSACGKSSLINCINGLIPFAFGAEATGTLRVDGKDVAEADIFCLSQSVGTVMQDLDCQFLGTTVEEDMAFQMENNEVSQQEMRKRVREAAAVVGIEELLDRYPYDLSGGQKQREALGSILTYPVKMLLLDEPLASLDPAGGVAAMGLIRTIKREKHATILISEHRLEDVLCEELDRIILMDGGRVVADMSVSDMLGSDLLAAHGIRQPLYLAALRAAGCAISPAMNPGSMERLVLEPMQVDLVRRWFCEQDSSAEKSGAVPQLSVQNLCFSYQECDVLEDVSFTVDRGEMLAIVGENGAGKSTLAKLICGFEQELSGDILFCGESLRDKTIEERAKKIGFVMQDPNHMISEAIVKEEVLLGLRMRGMPVEEMEQQAERVLELCDLYPYRNWPISALSYGQKKRVTIASVLALNPEIVILDEPTAGQDLRHYKVFMEFLSKLNQVGITIILISHDMHLVLEYTERSIALAQGRLLFDGSSTALLSDAGLVRAASLKRTSLFELAMRCNLPPVAFAQFCAKRLREVECVEL